MFSLFGLSVRYTHTHIYIYIYTGVFLNKQFVSSSFEATADRSQLPEEIKKACKEQNCPPKQETKR